MKNNHGLRTAPVRKQNNKKRMQAIRSQVRNKDDADKDIQQYTRPIRPKPTRDQPSLGDTEKMLRVSFLGGLEDVGEKNMAVIEYGDDAIVLDCGNNLGVELPGVNYTINDPQYLSTIAHKLRGYVITHGHLDHIGGLKHIVPDYPAPIYGSRYTIGLVEKTFDDLSEETHTDFVPDLNIVSSDSHGQTKLGQFTVEFIRVTHSLPDATAISINSPVGRIIATGDFRLDPEPLDQMPTDVTRLRQLGDEGVLLLMSDSSYADVEGRVPTESTLQQSFYDIIDNADGRIFVAAFSSNMNRIQMIINAAVAAGRRVALEGRGMLSYSEIAVRQGILKIPKGTLVPIKSAGTIDPEKLLVMCTGGQGEANAALQRMSEGKHRSVNLDAGDTVVISSSPIPGNEISYDQLSNRLKRIGVQLFRHPTHELDGCGPLHVSGHARRDELREMIRLTRPTFFVPVHGGMLRRHYHAELGIKEGMSTKNILLPDNGDSLYFTNDTVVHAPSVPYGGLLVDQNASIVSGVVVKDRLMLSQDGIFTVVLTIDRQTGRMLSSPDIVSRGYLPMLDSGELLGEVRDQIRVTTAKQFKKLDLERFKTDVRDTITGLLFDRTGRSPMVIVVVNTVSTSNIPQTRPVSTASSNRVGGRR